MSRNGDYSAQCPAHDDRTPSLSLGQGEKGAVVNCQVGCDTRDVVAELGLTLKDLFDVPQQRDANPSRVVAEYEYTDERGAVLFVKQRIEPGKDGRRKDFTIYRPLPGGQRAWGLKGVDQRPLYRLPRVIEAIASGTTVYVVEGEKDVAAAEKAGAVATCNFDGAAKPGHRTKWKSEYGNQLVDAHVVIVADNDDSGRAHAAAVAEDLAGKAASVRVVRGRVDTEAADLSDHLAAGYGLDDLAPLDSGAPPMAATTEEDSAGKGERGPSQASQLVKLARERFELFMSEDGRPYARKIDGPNIALPLRGKAGLRSQLARIFTDETGGNVPSQSALADCMTVLEGIAGSAEPRVPHVRVARHEGRIVVDLGTADGACVIIGPDGWERASRSPVLFRRSGAMKPLPVPVRDGDGLAKLHGMLNTSTEGFRLLAAWLIAAFIPDLPHPILTFRGEQGTGKSKAAQMVIGIIDPSGAPKRTAPRDLKSWAVQAFNSWGLCLDNVSTIADWLSDALCRAVTGDGVVDRALYSDDDVVVLEFRRVLAMTTIDAGALAGDLAERLLMIELNLIPDSKRREEAELDAAYRDAHASILASLFDLLAEVLKALPEVTMTERPRMADFARILAAVDKVNGWETFASYTASARNAVADVLDGEPFAQAVVALVDASGADGLELTAQEILDKVATPDRLPRKWPKDSTRAAGQLKRLAPALRTIGIEVDDSRRQTTGNRSRLYKLTTSESRRNAAPAAPTAPATSADQQEHAGAGENDSTRSGFRSARTASAAGAAGAGAGAGESTAPAHDTTPDQGKDTSPGAPGAPGAGMRLLSKDANLTGPCIRCHQPCQRYGDGGNALCSTCRQASAA
ncbi:toprim domain-containing protein [Planomonospora sp. ID82291]|nr:toprim domain-containing protein [Planomonospora sp. ID82291]